MEIIAGQGVPDFVLMDQLTEDAMWNNMKTRFEKDQIYTYIGDTVVAVNPYKTLDLFGNAVMDKYRGCYKYERQPHLYALANDAYRFMLQRLENQCVVISGESGAGKTEATKIIMRYIARVSTSSAEVDRIKELLLNSNPLLEAFGNATTLRNDNSSRFGKYMEIQFEGNGAPVGGRITNYLLEKSRVVSVGQGERNFHIFYQLLAGMPAKQLHDELYLTSDATKYYYLNRSALVKVSTINDSTDFAEVQRALKSLQFADSEVKQLYRVLASILHLGNVRFLEHQPPDGTGTTTVTIENPDVADTIASLLDCSPQLLKHAFTHRSITTGVGRRQSIIEVPLDQQLALYTRDAFAKALYDRLFNWLVSRINKTLACEHADDKVAIGLLDIYGFEIFQNNSFEQFCINYCNEKLQQLFIELTLKSEQEEYDREGIEWKKIDYFNNKIICDLIESKKPPGLISLMDDTCLISDATDKTLLDKLTHQFKTHKHYETYETTKNRQIPDSSFRIKHYAGDVTYHIEGFLDKNKDLLTSSLKASMQTSKLDLMALLFPEENSADSRKRPETAGTQFRTALNKLIDTLLKCNPHYVRCIKPNDEKRPGKLTEDRVRHQIRYLGLLENVRVRRAGFANRQPFDRFVQRYKMICPQTWPHHKGDLKAGAKTILDFLKIPAEEFRFGKTKVFIKNPKTLFALEEKRNARMPHVVTVMQKSIRRYLAVSNYAKRKAAMKILQFIRRNRSKGWLTAVLKTYGDLKKQPKLGKDLVLPEPPKVLANALNFFKQYHTLWRYATMIRSLKDEEREHMRQKVSAYTIFKGKKPYNVTRRFEADYLESPTNPNLQAYVNAMQRLFAKFGDTTVNFADFGDKVNRSSAVQRRGVVLTNQAIYKHDPKKFTLKQAGVPVAVCTSVSMSKYSDSWVVVHTNDNSNRDLVLNFGIGNEERLSEFVTVLAQVYKDLTRQELQILFEDKVTYNNSAKPNTPQLQLVFETGQKVKAATFKKGKINAIQIP